MYIIYKFKIKLNIKNENTFYENVKYKIIS